MYTERLNRLEEILKPIYNEHKEKLLFHGWHHITFVGKKAKIIAEIIGADSFLVESAALVHDLNYIVKHNSEASEGRDLRQEILSKAEYTREEIDKIEEIVLESHTATRTDKISEEGKALSDADTIFKALPITGILFTGKYLTENKVDLAKLAKKILEEQVPLVEKGIYFYTDFANKNYLKWAKTNLELWKNIQDCLTDRDILDLIEID